MEGIKSYNAARKEKQELNEASMSQLNELHKSPHDGTKGPLSLYNFFKSDPIPKGFAIPKETLTPPLEPVPAATTSDPPSLTYAPTLPTHEYERAPLQRHDSNEATCDSNSQHSANLSMESSNESLIPLEAKFNGHVATGMAKHLDGRLVVFEEDPQRTSTIDLSLTREEASSLKLNDEVTAVLHNDLTSALPFANDDDDPPHSFNSTHSIPDRQSPPALRRKSSTSVDGTSNLLPRENKSPSTTDAMQDIDNYGMGRRMAVENARQERTILIALFTQIMFYGILLTLLLVQTLHPGLLQV